LRQDPQVPGGDERHRGCRRQFKKGSQQPPSMKSSALSTRGRHRTAATATSAEELPCKALSQLDLAAGTDFLQHRITPALNRHAIMRHDP